MTENDIGIAFIFPGQGSQKKGMGLELFEKSEAARGFFNFANQSLGISVSSLCFEGSEEDLQKTENAQAAIGTVCLAAYEATIAENAWLNPLVSAGISFGELPNLVAAGVIDKEEYFQLIKERGRIMQGMENQGRMVAVLRVEKDTLLDICQGTQVYPAIYYPGYTIIAGLSQPLEETISQIKKAEGKIRETGVNYPFHTPLMEKARDLFTKKLLEIGFNDSKYPVVINPTAEITTSSERIKEMLPETLTRPVDAEEIVKKMLNKGVSLFIEFCPQPTLSGLINRMLEKDSEKKAISVYNWQTVLNLYTSGLASNFNLTCTYAC